MQASPQKIMPYFAKKCLAKHGRIKAQLMFLDAYKIISRPLVQKARRVNKKNVMNQRPCNISARKTVDFTCFCHEMFQFVTLLEICRPQEYDSAKMMFM